jgi:hypothetical protein
MCRYRVLPVPWVSARGARVVRSALQMHEANSPVHMGTHPTTPEPTPLWPASPGQACTSMACKELIRKVAMGLDASRCLSTAWGLRQ